MDSTSITMENYFKGILFLSYSLTFSKIFFFWIIGRFRVTYQCRYVYPLNFRIECERFNDCQHSWVFCLLHLCLKIWVNLLEIRNRFVIHNCGFHGIGHGMIFLKRKAFNSNYTIYKSMIMMLESIFILLNRNSTSK